MSTLLQIIIVSVICLWAIYRLIKALFFKKEKKCSCGCSECPIGKECSSFLENN
ncbi:MAG: FeoB-associated Cys-rich membrane protein [Bacteroidaceae bacterium]|nr:FeoB-associated Cys-rich membrane protein [Bacteroidaceae bacterium]